MTDLNITELATRTSYLVGNTAQSEFSVNFPFFDVRDINVYVDGTLQGLTTDYAITTTPADDGGFLSGTVTFNEGQTDCTIAIVRNIKKERLTDFPPSGGFNIRELNRQLDQLTAVSQDLQRKIDQKIGFKETDFDDDVVVVGETAANRAAWAFNRNEHLKVAEELSSYQVVGIDFNVDYMSAVLVSIYGDQTIHYIDEIRQNNSSTEMICKAIKEKWSKVKEVYPDPAGNARSTTSNRSDHQILKDFGFEVYARKNHPSNIDRLNALNRKLKDASGKISMTIDPKCKYLIKDLEQVQRDRKGGIDKSNLQLTHSLDAATYLIEYKYPIVQRTATSMKW